LAGQRPTGYVHPDAKRAGTFIQRFGSALNLNVHLHMLIPDGVYTLDHGDPRSRWNGSRS
jgi:hypothetical protein